MAREGRDEFQEGPIQSNKCFDIIDAFSAFEINTSGNKMAINKPLLSHFGNFLGFKEVIWQHFGF